MKKNIIYVVLIIVLFVASVMVGCKDAVTNNVINKATSGVKTGLFKISSEINGNHLRIGDFFVSSWKDNSIYCSSPLRKIEISLSDTLSILQDTLLPLMDPKSWATSAEFVRRNKEGNKLLFVRTRIIETIAEQIGIASVGALWEYNEVSNSYELLLDSTHNISSAVYMPNNDSLIAFYSFGLKGELGIKAGYYFFNRYTKDICLIFSYYSGNESIRTALQEGINGFDISPDGKKLLTSITHWGEVTDPIVVEYDLANKTFDTLKTAPFKISTYNQYLWLRYSPSGEDIVYSFYSTGMFSNGLSPSANSSIGIINRQTLNRSPIDIPEFPGYGTMAVCPTWSSDGHHICFGAAKFLVDYGVADYSLWIKTNVR